MKRPRERTVITVETFQRETVRLGKIRAWCEPCAEITVLFAPNEAVTVLQTTARRIFRLTEAGELHYPETHAGALFICRNSLASLNYIGEITCQPVESE